MLRIIRIIVDAAICVLSFLLLMTLIKDKKDEEAYVSCKD